MNKKKIIISILALVLLVVGGYQVTMANFNQNGNVNTKISASSLGIEIVDFDSAANKISANEFEFSSAMPGAIMTRQIGIQNTKDKDLYVRVIITRYWKNAEDKKETEANAEYIDIQTEHENQWLIEKDAGSNQERIVFYYKAPLAANEETSPFMDAIKISDEITDQTYSKYHANIKVEAEAIQKVGAQDAMLSQWGVEVTLDNQGNILSIVE